MTEITRAESYTKGIMLLVRMQKHNEVIVPYSCNSLAIEQYNIKPMLSRVKQLKYLNLCLAISKNGRFTNLHKLEFLMQTKRNARV